MKQALIVSGGTTDFEFGCSYIKEQQAELMIAVDSGMEFFRQAELIPDIIIGDFDSVQPDTLAYFEKKKGIDWVRLIPEKDDTDTEAAIRRAIEEKCKRIHLLGATGNRIDHVLGNIQLLGIGLSAQAEIFIVDKNNRIRMIDAGIQIKKEEQYGDYVSLIPFTPEVTGVTLTGMKYPLSNFCLKCYNSLGISNEIVSDAAEIKLRDGVLLVLETKDR